MSLSIIPASGVLRRIPIELIDVVVESRPLDPKHVDRLSASIDSTGHLEQPIEAYERGERYVLGDGRHRLAACGKLQHIEIDAIVKPDADDRVIHQAQLVANLQRQNLTPVEEALACEKLQENLDGNLDQVAVVIGRSRRWVEQRLAFNRLSPRVHHLIVTGELPLEHAYLIARVASHEKQEEIAGTVAGSRENSSDGRPEPLWRTKNLVERAMRSLKGVAWQLDVEFAGKPCCLKCPNNSNNQPTLFSDGQPKEAECLDASCYAEKNRAASNAVRKAVNFLGKESLKPTPKNAEKAIEAREVDFVNPKVVTAIAKEKASPDAQTSAEKSGRDRGAEEHKIRELLRVQLNEWKEGLNKRLSEKLQANPIAVALYLLITEVPEYDLLNERTFHGRDSGKKERMKAETVLFPLIDLLKKPSAGSLEMVAKKLRKGSNGRDDWPLSWGMPDSVRNRMCEVLKIERPEKPTYEKVKRVYLGEQKKTDSETVEDKSKKNKGTHKKRGKRAAASK